MRGVAGEKGEGLGGREKRQRRLWRGGQERAGKRQPTLRRGRSGPSTVENAMQKRSKCLNASQQGASSCLA